MRNLISTIILLTSFVLGAQEKKDNAYFDLNYFGGNTALHNNDILHLISGHPEGFIFCCNKDTFVEKSW